MRRKSQGQSPRVHVFKGQHVQRKERTEPLPRTGSRADATEKKTVLHDRKAIRGGGKTRHGGDHKREKRREIRGGNAQRTSVHFEALRGHAVQVLGVAGHETCKVVEVDGHGGPVPLVDGEDLSGEGCFKKTHVKRGGGGGMGFVVSSQDSRKERKRTPRDGQGSRSVSGGPKHHLLHQLGIKGLFILTSHHLGHPVYHRLAK